MDYQEASQSHVAAYYYPPSSYDPPQQPYSLTLLPTHQHNPSLNPNPNPNLQLDHQQHHYYSSSTTYSVDHHGSYASQSQSQSQVTVHGADYNAGHGSLPSYYTAYPLRFPDPTSNALPTNTAQQFVAPSYNHTIGNNTPKTHHHGKIGPRKVLKKTKIPQSVRCDVCKILCDTDDVLQKHRLGKKHKQNVEKLKAVVAGQTTSDVNSATPATDTGKSPSAQTKRKKASQKAADVETKKKRVLEGGAAVDAVRTCSICNVVCNSETVFQYHLAGQKHAAMVKKQALGMATQTA